MESAESDTSASPEELTKKSQESDDPSESESGEKKPTHIRLLVSKASAGSVIGKGGSTITEFEAKSGAQIQLSRKGGYFPGTTYRIVMISGTIKQVVTALELVFAKLHTELQAEDASDVELRRIRFVVPHTFCGCIIGKRGATIKSFIEYSKAGIKISLLDNTYGGFNDRVVTLSGTMEEQMCAIDLILSKLNEDDDYSQQVHSPNSYAGLYHSGMHGYNSVKYARSRFGEKENNKEDVFNSVTMGVSDEYIRFLLWRRGSFLKTINLLTGARIKISGRGDFISGTTDRKVTISGLQSSIDLAMSMIQKQVDGAKALSLLRVSLRNRLHLST